MTSPGSPTLKTASAADHSKVNPLRVVDGSQFWAVIIGIDSYPTTQDSDLRGCVCDATNVFRFLTKNMGVPENHIKLLLGPTSQSYNSVPDVASIFPIRANIIDALLGLSTNSRIQKGDNIIIYYAGHGTVYGYKNYPAPASSGDLGKAGAIEALCPIDRNTLGVNDDKRIPDISDRELVTILDEICRTKGHHITVILDCCHSASQTRGTERPIQGARNARPLSAATSIVDMFAIADMRLGELKDDEGSPRYRSISTADWTPEVPVTSHVLLGACQSWERANEVGSDQDGRQAGFFTSALLDSLDKKFAKPADLDRTLPTYWELIKGLPKDPANVQHPVVAGKYKGVRLWYTGPDSCCS